MKRRGEMWEYEEKGQKKSPGSGGKREGRALSTPLHPPTPPCPFHIAFLNDYNHER